MALVSAKVALITGGSSGIGLATAHLLAKRGWSVALVARNQAKLEAACEEIGPEAIAIRADLTDADEAAAIVDRCVARLGRLDALINNAGWSPSATIAQTNVAMAKEIFAVNSVAPCVSISRAWPIFERQFESSGGPTNDKAKGGVIVNISSIATVDPFEILYAYAAAKASVNLLARSAAKEGAKIGITAFAIAPGAVETELLRSLVSELYLSKDKTLAPEAVARVVVECIEGKRDAENGQTILMPSPE
jgi:NAD(P)-dependent dehydrogenase (short-subunit alcohol dehydrogenase family)